MFCPSCGAASAQKTNFCKKCGANMNPAANTVEVHLPRAGVSGMVWAIAGFSLIGLIASLIMLGSMYHPGVSDEIVFAFVACLMFIFSVAGLLTWQLARLINTYRDTVRQTINKAQFEVSPPPPQPQPQPVYIPAAQSQAPSVVEHTTRQMAGTYGEPQARE
ncbi:MAG TPA: zinc ribbon domain-containing protein [Blastocatellia bacterium]|nr:zinc ribbon domain-containing protein [Blastocatellia bacterium]